MRLLRSKGSVGELFSGRNNGIGLIRLCLALAVVVSHSRPLGFGQADVGEYFTGRQTNLGTMAVYGFFVLSGMLITRSARRTGILRYAWHRALRILPGLWVCLLFSALVVAPLVTLHEHGSLAGFWTDPWSSGGPLAYLRANWWTGVRQWGIHDLFGPTTPWGRKAGGASVFDGALWSLAYEMLCYVGVGLLAVTGVITRSRRFVLLLTVASYALIWHYYLRQSGWSGPLSGTGVGFDLPLLGGVSGDFLLLLGFLFLCGATLDLYREYIPVNDALGVAALLALAISLRFGGFFVVGMPAYAYLLVWIGIRAPRQVHWVGRRNDYSYGLYIYGFLGQQVLASIGANRWGFVPFVGISIVAAAGAAFVSWHVVEHNALRLKEWTPRLPARWRVHLPAQRTLEVPEPEHAPNAPRIPGQQRRSVQSNSVQSNSGPATAQPERAAGNGNTALPAAGVADDDGTLSTPEGDAGGPLARAASTPR